MRVVYLYVCGVQMTAGPAPPKCSIFGSHCKGCRTLLRFPSPTVSCFYSFILSCNRSPTVLASHHSRCSRQRAKVYSRDAPWVPSITHIYNTMVNLRTAFKVHPDASGQLPPRETVNSRVIALGFFGAAAAIMYGYDLGTSIQ